MGRIEMSTPISATPEALWDLLCDVRRYPEWDTFADEVTDASHERLELGSTYQERTGRDLSDWRVTTFDPPRRMVHVGVVPFLGELTIDVVLEPQGDATVLRHAIEYEVMRGRLRPIGRLIEAVYVDRYARTNMAKTHANAKRIVESGAAGVP